MNSQVVKLNRNLIPEIKSRLQAGEVIILPTDTVYALVAKGNDIEAVNRLRQIKAFSSLDLFNASDCSSCPHEEIKMKS